MKRTKLRIKGHSTTAELKQDIQDLVRAIVILRDGGCILRGIRYCDIDTDKIVLQADHLITRANSATYADTRLIVCACRRCHLWKKYNPKQYDALVKAVLSPERVKLWEACEKDSWKPKRTDAYDWKMEIIALKQELARYTNDAMYKSPTL